MEKIRFVPLTFGSDTKTYVRADTIVELSEDGDKTSVYISNSDVPIKVKESVGEILAKIRGTAWEQAPIDRIEPGTDGYAYKMTISNGKEFEKQNCDDAVSRQAVHDEMIKYGFHASDMTITEFVEDVLSSVTLTTRWIPVSERLPKERKPVLVYCLERKNIYCAYYEEKQWWIYGAYFTKIEEDVIAWQPLPEAYKESEVERC